MAKDTIQIIFPMAEIVEIIASPFGYIEVRDPEDIAELIKEKLTEVNGDCLVIVEETEGVSE